MKKRFIYAFVFITLIAIIKINAQQNTLIFENDSIAIYDTQISLNSKENISPVIYKNGLIYASANLAGFYKLYYSDLKNKPQKIKLSNKFEKGQVAVFKDEIYVTKNNSNSNLEVYNFAICKGAFNNLKISNIEQLPICKQGFVYSQPSITKDGSKMVVITNERGLFHLLELKRNENNEWEPTDVVFITQSGFKILNPTFYNENTIYFSSNISEAKIDRVEYTIENNKPVINNVYYNTGDFNIFKTIKVEGKWSLPQKVSVFNSEFDDLSVVFKTEKTGYLNTFRYDDTDNIYYFELKQ